MFEKEISRRAFTKLCGGAVVLGAAAYAVPSWADIDKKALYVSLKNTNVIWLQASGCSGCSVSTLNYYNIANKTDIGGVVLGDAYELDGNFVNFRFQPTLMAGQGYVAMQALKEAAQKPFVLIVEGGISVQDEGFYAEVGMDESDTHGITILEHMKNLAPKATAILAVGSCATWGGVPAGKPNPTGIQSVSDFLKKNKIETPLVNIPGCPTHPDWVLLTVATILTKGLDKLETDKLKRPKMFFHRTCHEQCPRRGQFNGAKFATHLSDPEGCLYLLGCRAPEAHGDCPSRLWNNKGRWCVDCGAPSIACTEPSFPDNGPLYLKMNIWHPMNTVAIGLFGVAAVGIGAAFLNSRKNKKKGTAHE